MITEAQRKRQARYRTSHRSVLRARDRSYREANLTERQAAGRVSSQAATEKAQRETRPAATRHGYPWLEREVETAAREDLTTRKAALLLGRTYRAVASVRHQLAAGKLAA